MIWLQLIPKIEEIQKVFNERYEIRSLISQSPLKQTYLAWDKSNNKEVFIKEINVKDKLEDGINAIIRSIEYSNTLKCRHLTRVYTFQYMKNQGTILIITEAVSGIPISTLLSNRDSKQ